LKRRSKQTSRRCNPYRFVSSFRSPSCRYTSNLRKCLRLVEGELCKFSSLNRRAKRVSIYLCNKIIKISKDLNFTFCKCTNLLLKQVFRRISFPDKFEVNYSLLNSFRKEKNSSSVWKKLPRHTKPNWANSIAVLELMVNSTNFLSNYQDNNKKCKFHFRHA